MDSSSNIHGPNVRWAKAICLVAVSSIASALLERALPRATEAAYVLKSVTFAAVGLLSAHPWTLGAANAGVAALLFLVRDDVDAAGLSRAASGLADQLNRSAGHLEGLFTWLSLAVWWAPSLWLQATGVLAVAVLGPVAIDALTFGGRGPAQRWRLLVPVAVTLTGLVIVLSVASTQWGEVAPLVGAVLAGLAPRTAWSLWNETSLHASASRDVGWARFVDRLFMMASLAVLVLLPLRALGPGHRASAENRMHRTVRWLRCTPDRAEATPPFSLFIVADSQFHALDGKRSGFHLDLVDTEIPVSVRPVELDLLSAATLRSFADMYRKLHESRPEMQWAHLGDTADLGCTSELERFVALAPRFGLSDLAGAVPGNHDVSFLGNLSWHPDWEAACPEGRSTPAIARSRIGSLMADGAGKVVHRASNFLASVSVLGHVGGADVVGVFLDTTDAPRDRIGIAGAQGGISSRQREWVEQAVGRFAGARVLLFGHHPIDQWTSLSRRELERLATALGPRLWGIVSAHTHLAAVRSCTLAGRTVPEFIVGSTIDPPQEAAVLEGDRQGPDGHWVLRLRTLQAVQRPEMTCADDRGPAVTAETCDRIFKALRATPACAALFAGVASDPGRRPPTSDECAKTVDAWWPWLEPGLLHADSPRELDCLQEARAERLLSCVGLPITEESPLSDPRLPERVLSIRERDPAELVCLSWAASVLQSHKGERWGMAQAIAFSLDPSATYGEFEAEWPEQRSSPSTAPVGASGNGQRRSETGDPTPVVER